MEEAALAQEGRWLGQSDGLKDSGGGERRPLLSTKQAWE